MLLSPQSGENYAAADIDEGVRAVIDSSRGRVVPVFATDMPTGSRYLPSRDVTTSTVMWLDDNVDVAAAEVERAFQLALQTPAQLVGFSPHLVRLWPNEFGELDWQYCDIGQGALEPEFRAPRGQYSLLELGGGAFANVRVLRLVASALAPDVRDMLLGNHRCADLALNFAMANATGNPPTFVLSSSRSVSQSRDDDTEGGWAGSAPTHAATASSRRECLELLLDAFGENPLRSSDAMLAPFAFDKKEQLRPLMTELPTVLPYGTQGA